MRKAGTVEGTVEGSSGMGLQFCDLSRPERRALQRCLRAMPEAEALARARALLLSDGDRLVAPQRTALLREHRTTVEQSGIQNLVFIIMESFSGAFVGALGHPGGVTPAFDHLAEEGLLFERFFANGTHTHQGMFASVACFPNLPGFEYLMQMPEGMQGFSGLGNLLAPRGYSDLYVYNGSFSWDNQNGFFGNQGFHHFVGREDYVDPRLDDPTWGVSDEDMFARAAVELSALPADRPFFAVLQTLSNHTPYHLPAPLPSGFGRFFHTTPSTRRRRRPAPRRTRAWRWAG